MAKVQGPTDQRCVDKASPEIPSGFGALRSISAEALPPNPKNYFVSSSVPTGAISALFTKEIYFTKLEIWPSRARSTRMSPTLTEPRTRPWPSGARTFVLHEERVEGTSDGSTPGTDRRIMGTKASQEIFIESGFHTQGPHLLGVHRKRRPYQQVHWTGGLRVKTAFNKYFL